MSPSRHAREHVLGRHGRGTGERPASQGNRSVSYKLLFSGPVGAGKTTAIATLSDAPPVSTDMAATDETAHLKPRTTVALDFGVMRLGDGQALHLYGTPGQERFDFMWEILQQGAIGLVLLVANTAPDPLGQLEQFVVAYRPFITATSLAVGLTHTDLAPNPTIDEHVAVLTRNGVDGPVFTVDAREQRDVARLVEALLFDLDPQLSAAGTLPTEETRP